MSCCPDRPRELVDGVLNFKPPRRGTLIDGDRMDEENAGKSGPRSGDP